jgi:hypothetical protein
MIAIDWDNNQAYLVAGNARGANFEVQHALTWTEEEPPFANPERTGARLKDRLKAAGIAPAPVLACVPRDQVNVKEIRFPSVPETEEPAVVRFQAIKEMADNPDELVIDYFVRSRPDEPEKRAAAVAIRKKVLEGHQKLCQAAGLKLQGVLPRLVGVMANLRKVMGATVLTPPPEPADGAICFVVAGEKQAEVAVVKGEQFLLARSFPSGPGLAAGVRNHLKVHEGQRPDAPIVAIYVSGKGAGELREKVLELLEGVPTHTFDPFAGSDLPGLPTGQRGLFSGPLGLLQMSCSRPLPINFVSPRQPKPVTNPNYARLRVAALVVALLIVGLFVAGQMLISSTQAATAALVSQKDEMDESLKAAKAAGKKLKDLEDWDNPVWLDELYDLAKRADLKSLAVTSVSCKELPRTGSRFIAQLTVLGKLLGKTPEARRAAWEALLAQIAREGHYQINHAGSKHEDRTFVLVLHLERRAPSSFTAVIEDPTIPKAKTKGKSK